MPLRNFGAAFFIGYDIALDVARDRLYSVNAFRELFIIDGASTATASVSFWGAHARFASVSYDPAKDRLYVGGSSSNALIFNSASSLVSGTTVPAAEVFTASEIGATAYRVWGWLSPDRRRPSGRRLV